MQQNEPPQMRCVLREGIVRSRHGHKTTRLIGVIVLFEDNEVWGIGGCFVIY